MDTIGIVTKLGQGRLLDELAEALALVAAEVVATGKPGAVTLKLEITTSQQGDEMVLLKESIARKMPARSARGAFLFALEGELWSRDPRQTEMPFRAVETETEIRESASQAAAVREA